VVLSDHLLRTHAPISDAAWTWIDQTAEQMLRHYLAARAVLDFEGPKGWAHSGEGLGRVTVSDPPVEGVQAAIRVSQPLVELRTQFDLEPQELEVAERGGVPDLSALEDAARRAALAEDRLLFDGYGAGSLEGVVPASPHDLLEITNNYGQFPSAVALAVDKLRSSGIDGPYAIAMGARCYTGVIETTEHGGYPVLEHLKLILGGSVVWAPAVDGAIVVSTRGGDYTIVCGEDLTVGYRSHSGDAVTLYIEESLTLLIKEPAAAVALRHPTDPA
jgi:uncharacterized linocin/CFP29 family protein